MATSAVSHAGNALPGQDLHCFICDAAVTGRYYTLATCRAQNSKVRLIEKLGQLVGERYMVVISEDDIICRGCATLINTLDRLETEMSSVRAVVLRFLEKKYSLEDGELVNSKPSGAPAPPPQITPAPQGRDKDGNRKRKAPASSDGDSDSEWTDTKKKDPKSNMWMQCNKCKYTTDYNAFMIHHVLQQKKKATSEKNENKDSSNRSLPGAMTVTSIETIDSIIDPDKPTVKRFKSENVTESDQNQTDIHVKQQKVVDTDSGDSETVEMIAAEINDFHSNSNPTSNANDMVITSVSQHNSTNKNTLVMAHPQGTALATGGDGEVTIVSGMVVQGEDGQTVTNLEEGTTICMMPISDEGTGERQAILDETGESGGVYVHVVDMSGQEVQGIVQGEVAAQHEDGTVEMVEVMWDQMVTNEDDGDGTQEINF